MTTNQAVAIAIHRDLDILEALHEVQDMDVEKLESYLEKYIVKIQEQFADAVAGCNSADEMFQAVIKEDVSLPKAMILKMCKTIEECKRIDCEYRGQRPDGKHAYLIRLSIAL